LKKAKEFVCFPTHTSFEHAEQLDHHATRFQQSASVQAAQSDLFGTVFCQRAYAAIALDLEMMSEGFFTRIDDRFRRRCQVNLPTFPASVWCGILAA
jgi:hypothetical protein